MMGWLYRLQRKLDTCFVWFRYMFNKEHLRNTWNYLFHHWPWDTCYMYECEYGWLKEAAFYYRNRGYEVSDTDDTLRWIDKCISLLEIILDKRQLFHMEYTHIETKDYTKLWKYVCDVNVNLRNKERFKYRCANWGQTNDKGIQVYKYSTDIYDIEPSELYKTKALYLYHRIKYEHSSSWWD